MKKLIKFLCFVLLFISLFAFVACEKTPGTDPNDGEDDPIVEPEITPTLSLEKDDVSLFIGESFAIKAIVENLDGYRLEFSSDDSQIASVDKTGLITANGVGSAQISVKLVDTDLVKVVNVKVNGVPKIKLVDKSVSLTTSSEYQLVLEKEYVDEVKWSSSDETIATVNNGLVKALKEGTVTITVTAGNLSDSCEIKVIEESKILVNGKNTMYVGGTNQLTASLKGYSGAFTWESLDTDIATVNEKGVVTGLIKGKASIICSADGMNSIFEIDVLDAPTIEVSGKNTLYIGRSTTLVATVTNSDEEVVWESKSPEIASVNSNGVVTAISSGIVFIYAKVGNVKATFKVTVSEEPNEIFLDFAGGVSAELYKASEAIASFTINHYGGTKESGYSHFWADGFKSNIYLTNRDGDPTATFSDRIYIAKNPYSGYYEIINILTSGGSSWPTVEKGFAFDAEYVITISSSYSNYNSIHSKVLNLEIGQIVIIAASDWTNISNSTPSNVKFYNKNIEQTTMTITQSQYSGLPTPSRIGFTFMGWYDEFGNKVENIESVDKYYELTARWDELNPVTDISVNNVKINMTKGDIVQLESNVIPSNAYFKDVFYSSSNPDIINVSGKGLVTAVNSGEAILYVTDYMERVTKEYKITVYSESSVDVEFPNDYKGYLNVGETVQMIGKYYGRGESGYVISYASDKPEIVTVSENGLLTANKNGEAVITVSASNGNKNYELKVNVLVGAKEVSDRLDEVLALLQEYNFGESQTINFCMYNDGTKRYYKAEYGSVNYYLFDDFIVHRDYEATAEANSSGHRSRRSTDQIEFVTVHDTATLTGTVVNIASGMASGSTSIHYTVGNYMTYSVVPEKYIAYHAGDGTGTPFVWNNTNVKANGDEAPIITVVKKDGSYFFAINGEVTNLRPSISNGTKTISDPTKALTSLGPVWKIKDGYYYIGNTHADFSQTTAGVIGSYGGNNNSIGIEMCVNTSNDMYDTLQRTAQLVADILIRNKIDLTRVKQHNTWTGKNCPQVILAGDYWDEFMKMVTIQYILAKDYSDIKISMKSNNPDVVTDTGRIVTPPKTTQTVSYDITVTSGEVSKTITLYTVVRGTTTWEQWNGLYPSSRLWQNGKYIQ